MSRIARAAQTTLDYSTVSTQPSSQAAGSSQAAAQSTTSAAAAAQSTTSAAAAARSTTSAAAAAQAFTPYGWSWKEDRWVRPFFLQYKKVLFLALFLGVVTFVFSAGLMFTSGYLISSAAGVPESVIALQLPLIFVRIFGIGKPILHYLERLRSHDWVLRMTSQLRLKLFVSLETKALFFRATHRTGDVLGLLSEDIGHLQNLYLRTVFPTIVAWLLWFVILIFAGFFSPFLLLLFALTFFVMLVLLPLVSILVCGSRRARAKALKNELYAELTDNVLGVSDWIFSQRAHEYRTRYQKAESEMKKLMYQEERFNHLRDVVAQVVYALAGVYMVVWAAGYFGGTTVENAHWIAAFVLGFFPLIDAYVPLPSALVNAYSYKDSLDRLNALPHEDVVDNTELLKPVTSELVVSGVHFTYPDSTREVLRGIDLTIPTGQKIAVLGRSGAGKSTLASLMRGDLLPTAGSVSLGGIPCARFGDEIANYLGVIQQNTYLFHMTLFENIRIARPDATEEEVLDVLEKVGLKHLVDRAPQGLHTLVDEGGLMFSGGERHRIALARVLLRDVPVVILDEPCVGLDPKTERELLRTLFAALKGKTIIMVTHHLLGASECDRVIFIEEGRIEIDGSPNQLVESNERYRQLKSFDEGWRF